MCENYNCYSPIDKRILSPVQIQKKLQKKESKKVTSEASKRGKRNKRSGYTSEKSLEKKLNSWGFECKRVVLSGALKGELSGDLQVFINGNKYKIENKKRANFNSYYKLTEPNVVIDIQGLCLMMNEEVFHQLLLGITPEVKPVENKRFKKLSDFFSQDDCPIVSMTSSYKPYIFAVTYEFYQQLSSVASGGVNQC